MAFIIPGQWRGIDDDLTDEQVSPGLLSHQEPPAPRDCRSDGIIWEASFRSGTANEESNRERFRKRDPMRAER